MAIIKNNRNTFGISPVIEDIRPSGDRIYIWGEGYDLTTLSHKWDSFIQHSTTGTAVGGWGAIAFAPSPATAINRSDSLLFLGQETLHVTRIAQTINVADVNLDPSAKLSMDPATLSTHYKYIQTSTGDNVIYAQFQAWGASTQVLTYFTRYNQQGSLDNNLLTKLTTGPATTTVYPIWFNPATNNLVNLTVTGNASPFLTQGPGRIQSVLSGPATALAFTNPTGATNQSHQFIGVSTSGQSLWLRNAFAVDHEQLIIRYDDAANTLTTLHTFNTIPSAAGTSAGGNRTTTFGNAIVKFASNTFPDPSSAGNTAFYVPYLDVNGRYHPHFIQWNRTTDVFVRNSDITVDWAAAGQQTNVWAPDTTSAASTSTGHGLQRFWYNETFTVTAGETTTRYLTLIQTHGNGIVNDADPLRRTIVTFRINPANPKALIYHSHVVVPRTIQNTIWLSDDKTVLGVVTFDNFYIYSFNQTQGWTLVVDLPFRMEAVGRDMLGRIWAVDPGILNAGRLHLITPNIPATVRVNLAQTSYNYQGVDINSTGTVDALSATGQRVAVPIKLRVVGNGLKIINGEAEEVTELVVQTNTSAVTTFNIRVTGAGTNSIFASIEI
jgi:hypothetical protein